MTALPGFCAGLEARWSGLAALTALGTRVDRHPPLGAQMPAGDWLIAEFSGDPQATADARAQFTPNNMAGDSIREDGEVDCVSLAQSGGKDVAASEAQAFAQIAAVVADLATDKTVGGLVQNAFVTAGEATSYQNAGGVAVVVPFTVTYYTTYTASAA